jgi:hypothetical protein
VKCWLVLFLICGCHLTAEELRVENRPPQLDEIGYRPGNGSVATFNPPSLAWVHEKPAQTYIVQWSPRADFGDAVIISNLNFNCYTHNAPLPAGEYFWRYQYSSTNGISDWSVVRRFIVASNSIEFPLPSLKERSALVPEKHPRLFLRPEDLPKLRALAKGREAKRFAEIRKTADTLLGRPLTAEPAKLGSATDKKNLELIANWWLNRETAVRAASEAEILAFVYLITQEKKYGTAARERILDLAKWNPDGPTNFRLNCEAAKPLLHRISRAYDWAYDTLTPAERVIVQKAVKRRIEDAWVSGEVGRGVGHINKPLNSHGNRTWHKIGESGIVFLSEIPEADLWLDYALNKFYACYPVWSDEDGGWHEGAAYLGGYMSKTVWWLHVVKSALNIDGFQKPFFAQVGDFPLYLAPPGTPNVGFGDNSYKDAVRGWGGFMEFFIRNAAHESPRSYAPYWRWWCEQWKMEGESGVLGFLYNAQLPPLPKAKAPTNLPSSKIFHGVGIASLHSTLLNSSNDVHLLFKSSPFGSQSHGHNPQNTFQLNAYGEALLTPCVYRDLHGSDFHYKWAHETVSQNGVLVNGKGQLPHSAKSRGRIVESKLTSGWDYVLGDAVEAYDGRLTRALRHVVFIKPDIIVMLDDLAAPEPAQFQFMLHALRPFNINEKKNTLHLHQPSAGVLVNYLSDQPLAFRQWEGYPFEAIRGTIPNQSHVEASTTAARSEYQLLSVYLPHRGTRKPRVDAQRLETESALATQITRSNEVVTVAFKKFGVTGEAEVAGIRFSDAVAVRKSAK